MKLKTLIYDIETSPITVRQWRPSQQWTPSHQVKKYGFMLTWAAKWRGEDKVMSQRLTKQQILDGDDRDLAEGMAELIRDADVIVAHYGDKFDKPYVNARLAYHRLEPLALPRTIDTKKLASRDLLMPHNNLDGIAQFAGIEQRKKNVDHTLWDRVLDGPDHVEALKEMEDYNRQDVVVLEEIFDWMLPYVDRVARLYEAERDHHWICPTCGAEGPESFIRRGYYRTQASTFHKLQCKNCKKYTRERSSIPHKRSKLYPL